MLEVGDPNPPLEVEKELSDPTLGAGLAMPTVRRMRDSSEYVGTPALVAAPSLLARISDSGNRRVVVVGGVRGVGWDARIRGAGRGAV